jgi:heptosyltransferase II
VAEPFHKILVIQTAFIGDAILTLPLLQTLKFHYPQSSVDVVVVPRAAEIFSHHPAISQIIQYDKRGRDKGLNGLLRLRNKLRAQHYDLIIVPHRSLRSALLTWMLKPAISIGFDRSAGRWLLKNIVRYNPSDHEIERNLSLLNPLKLPLRAAELPCLYPSVQDAQRIDSILKEKGLNRYANIAAIAPGTIWNTKRWPAERFASLCKQVASEDTALVLLGGSEDEVLCKEVIELAQANHVFSAAGKLSLLQSAEMIRRCRVLISNDSAPMHIAVAVGTPVVAIFGATIPEFGFAPRGPRDIVIQINGLQCRPCSSHGGSMCPIKTFVCMLSITPEVVANNVRVFLKREGG